MPRGSGKIWMNVRSGETGECCVCHKHFPVDFLRDLGDVSPGVIETIRCDLPDCPDSGHICRVDLSHYRNVYLEGLLRSERGELSALDREVLDSLKSGETVATDVETAFEGRRTFGERAADAVASFGGSWRFIGLFTAVLVLWIVGNGVVAGGKSFDPYPFILLNLVLSCIAAAQAPIIMMSQRRTEAKDRMRSENDYKVNLKAELEIRRLHEKIDHKLSRQWDRLVEIQRVQIELIQEAAKDAQTSRREQPGALEES